VKEVKEMQTLQFGGNVAPQQFGAQQVGGYYPYQTDWTGMFSMMMPMIMMIMMFAILTPMFKGITESAK
jgi:hypothetical protein